MLPGIMTPDGRRAWAFFALLGAGLVFTVFAGFAVWNLRGHADWSGVLGLAAHVQVFGVIGFFGWTLGRRMLGSATRDGITFDDRPAPPPAPPSPYDDCPATSPQD